MSEQPIEEAAAEPIEHVTQIIEKDDEDSPLAAARGEFVDIPGEEES